MKAHDGKFAVRLMCRVLSVSPSGYYAWRSRTPSLQAQARVARDTVVEEAFRGRKGRAGAPRLAKQLGIGRRQVAQSLRRQGLRAKAAKKFKATTNSNHCLPVAENLLQQDFTTQRPNQAWVGDITYIGTDEGWLYLAVVLDLFSRKVVGWSMSERMTATLVCDALRMALFRRKRPRGVVMHLRQARCERIVEAAAQVAVKALDFAFGLGPVRPAQAGNKAAVPREIEERWLEPMLARSIGIALEHDGFHVVVEDLVRHAAEEIERVLVARQQRLQSLVGDEFDVTGAAEAQRGHERRQRRLTTPEYHPVTLQLLAGLRLESHHRLGRLDHTQRPQEGAQATQTAVVAARADLLEQRRRRQPGRMRCTYPLLKIATVRVELVSATWRPLHRHRTGIPKIAPDRVARNVHLPSDVANALPLAEPNPDFHDPLSAEHGPLERSP